MYSPNLKVSGLDTVVGSAPRTTEAISVWEKWGIPVPDVTGSAESGVCVSATLVIYSFNRLNAVRRVRECVQFGSNWL